jgi:hypothetical protein
MKALGPNSVSSGLALVLKIAYAFAAIWVVGTVIIGLASILVLVVSAQSHAPPPPLPFLPTSWTFGIPDLVYQLAVAVGAIAIVRRLRALFDAFAANEPFAAGNAEHLRSIWVTLVVIEIIRVVAFMAARVLMTLYAAGDVSPLPSEIASPLDLSRWFVIFVVVILAEVFRSGTRLREDSELTV